MNAPDSGQGSPPGCGTSGCAVGPASTAGAPLSVEPSGWRARFTTLFGLDLRSLAAMRIALGIVLLCDLAFRCLDLEAHYTDFGIIPRSSLYGTFNKPLHWTIHAAFGSPAGLALIFSFQALCALAFTIGYRTRVATLLCWLLWVSLNNRNLMIIQGGDQLVRCLLFWCLFIPISGRWSVDSALNHFDRSRSQAWLGMGGLALITQIALVYWCTMIFRWHYLWMDGSALMIALQIDAYSTPLGDWLRQFPTACRILSWASALLEIIAPLLILIPFRRGLNRTLAGLLMVGFHVMIAATLHVGLFSFIACAAWLSILPAQFWDVLATRRFLRSIDRKPQHIVYDADCAMCKTVVQILRGVLCIPRDRLHASKAGNQLSEYGELLQREQSWVVVDQRGQTHLRYQAWLALLESTWFSRMVRPLFAIGVCQRCGDRLYRWVAGHRHRVAPFISWVDPSNPLPRYTLSWPLCAIALLLVLAWNLRTIDWHKPNYLKDDLGLTDVQLEWKWLSAINGIFYATGLEQKWNMFSPFPFTDDGWYVIEANTSDGQTIDVFNRGHFIHQQAGPISYDKPDDVSTTYVRQRWRKYLNNLSIGNYNKHLEHFAHWLKRSWDRTHRTSKIRIIHMRIIYVRERTNPDGSTQEPEQVELLDYRCNW